MSLTAYGITLPNVLGYALSLFRYIPSLGSYTVVFILRGRICISPVLIPFPIRRTYTGMYRFNLSRGAVDETRTRNNLLGRQMLYQLNYYRMYMLLLLRGATALALNADVIITTSRWHYHASVKYVVQKTIYGFFVHLTASEAFGVVLLVMVRRAGLEPTTNSLKGYCSTN